MGRRLTFRGSVSCSSRGGRGKDHLAGWWYGTVPQKGIGDVGLTTSRGS